jgi:hypothetical protein
VAAVKDQSLMTCQSGSKRVEACQSGSQQVKPFIDQEKMRGGYRKRYIFAGLRRRRGFVGLARFFSRVGTSSTVAKIVSRVGAAAEIYFADLHLISFLMSPRHSSSRSPAEIMNSFASLADITGSLHLLASLTEVTKSRDGSLRSLKPQTIENQLASLAELRSKLACFAL